MKKASLFAGFVLLFSPALALASGTQTYSTAGTYTFTVPSSYGTITVQVWGSGASGAPFGNEGGDGATSKFNNALIAGGAPHARGSAGGTGGSASGGTTNTTGASGQDPPSGTGGAGGSAPSGGAGGAGGTSANYDESGHCAAKSGASGAAPGGGGGGSASAAYPDLGAGGGGSGGYVSKTYTTGQLTAGSGVSVVVGAGDVDPFNCGGDGAAGRVTISWTDPPTPTCSVTFGSNPIPYASSTTLTWTSANATTMYVNSVGYVSASGSTSVGPLAATDYSCSAGNGTSTTTSSAILSVGPTQTFSQSASSGYPSDSYTLTWSSTNATSCAISGKNPGLSSTTPWSTTAGSQATTTAIVGTTRWSLDCSGSGLSTSTTLTHAVSSASCTLDGVTIPSGTSATFYSQTSAPSGGLCSAYQLSRTCTNGVLSGSSSYSHASCSCTQSTSYTCPTSSTIASTTVTSSCSSSTTNTSCSSPSFCSPGVSSCLYPSISYSSFTSDQGDHYTGHIALHPSLLATGATSKVFWNLDNASSCTVTGTNGDSWSGTSSGTAGTTTAPILQSTTYALSCEGYDGSTPPSVSETATVDVLPVFQER